MEPSLPTPSSNTENRSPLAPHPTTLSVVEVSGAERILALRADTTPRRGGVSGLMFLRIAGVVGLDEVLEGSTMITFGSSTVTLSETLTSGISIAGSAKTLESRDGRETFSNKGLAEGAGLEARAFGSGSGDASATGACVADACVTGTCAADYCTAGACAPETASGGEGLDGESLARGSSEEGDGEKSGEDRVARSSSLTMTMIAGRGTSF